MRLWKLARMRMTRRFILLHNLVILAFERALLGVGIQCCLAHWISWWLEHELARTIPIKFGDLNRSPPKITSDHCIKVSLLA